MGDFCWLSAPSSLNRKFVNNGTKVAQFRETVNNAIELGCNIIFEGIHSPRACLLRAVSILLSYAPDRDWDLEKEMMEWGVEGRVRSFRTTLEVNMH